MQRFVNFSDLPESLEVKDGRVDGPVPLVWDMDLPPHVDLERLQLNVPRLRAMHRAAAVTASVVTSHEGNVTETTPNIVGVNPDGSAIAGKSGVTKKAKRSRQFNQGVDYIDSEFGWTALAHSINRPEAADMVVERTSDGQTSEIAWGGY